MYTAFYGLREKPFSLTPNPAFLYLSDSHREAMAHLVYGLEQGEGFIVLAGEVGTGKTTLCRSLLERNDWPRKQSDKAIPQFDSRCCCGVKLRCRPPGGNGRCLMRNSGSLLEGNKHWL